MKSMNGIRGAGIRNADGLATPAMLTAAAAMLILLAGCSAQQGYGAAQAWQRNECNRLPDPQERARCQASTSKSYEDYQREAQAARGQAPQR